MSGEPVPADQNLQRKLELAKDPDSMREILQRHLRPLGGEDYQIRECQISFARHRGGVRHMLHYTLHLVDPGTGRERSQLVTGTMYPRGRTRQISERLRRGELEHVDPGASPFFEPFFYIPDLDMLMQVFPYDQRLPALRLLTASPPPDLERKLLARFGPGDWHTEEWEAQAVRYRVGLRATLRVRVQAQDTATGRATTKHFYAKVYRHQEEGEQTYRLLLALRDKATVGQDNFAVARPVVYLGALRTLIQEEVSGTSLRGMILDEEDPTPAVRKAARALAALHLDEEVVPPKRHLLKDEIDRLEVAGDLLRSVQPHLGHRIQEIVGAIVDGLEEVAPAPTHGDFKSVHVLFDGERLYLLDLDSFAGADPILDVANFLASITITPLRSRSSLDHRSGVVIGRPFVEEYFAHVPEDWRDRLPFHYASAMLKKAALHYRRQEPDWLDKVEVLIKEAEDSLAGKVW